MGSRVRDAKVDRGPMRFAKGNRGLLVSLTTTLFLAVSQDAAAAPSESLAVVVALDGETEPIATALWPELLREIGRHSNTKLVFAEEKVLSSTYQEMARRRDEAEQELELGRAAIGSLDFATAELHLSRAISLLERSDLRENVEDVLHVMAWRASAFFYLGMVRQAVEELVQVLGVRPSFTFDPNWLTPEMEGLLLEAQEKLRLLQPVSIELQSSPGSAHIWVNGELRGSTPREIEDILPGLHLFTLVSPVHGFAQEWVRVAPGETIRLRLEQPAEGARLRSLLDAVASGLAARHPSQSAAALARWGGVESVWIVAVQRLVGGYKLVGARVAADGHVEAFDERETADLVALRALLSAQVSSLSERSRARGPDGEALTEVFRPRGLLDSRAWGFISLGAGLGAGAIAGTLGWSASSQASEAQGIPQLRSEEFESAVLSAKRKAGAANILYAASVTGIGLGTWLLLRDSGGGGTSRAPAVGAAVTDERVLVFLGGSF